MPTRRMVVSDPPSITDALNYVVLSVNASCRHSGFVLPKGLQNMRRPSLILTIAAPIPKAEQTTVPKAGVPASMLPPLNFDPKAIKKRVEDGLRTGLAGHRDAMVEFPGHRSRPAYAFRER